MSSPLRVLYVTSECAPWSKTGGLADVSAALPAALRALGADVRVMMPAYSAVPSAGAGVELELPATKHLPAARVLAARLPNDVPVLLVDCPALYARDGGPYQSPAGEDWQDNAQRFGQLCRAAAAFGTQSSGAWCPDVVHCNDWQTGLVPAYLRYASAPHAASLMTIHNLAFQGLFPAHVVAELGLPPESFAPDGLEFYGQCSFLKAGLWYADALTTVSPGYAAEIVTETHGMGLHGLLASRRNVLTGILNGIDTGIWNPATDPHIARRYDAATLADKSRNKRALQLRAGLPQADVPLLAVVSRLTPQKGVDWIAAIGAAVAGMPAQLVVLGRGDAAIERDMQTLAASHQRSISATLEFDEAYAHMIEAGADIFLMPSRFEPCGMNQMYSQRYGTVPVVRATGGLADSVIDYGQDGATGFLFTEPGAQALLAAIVRATTVYADKATWRSLQLSAMKRDFSWQSSAARYLAIYRELAARSVMPRS